MVKRNLKLGGQGGAHRVGNNNENKEPKNAY